MKTKTLKIFKTLAQTAQRAESTEPQSGGVQLSRRRAWIISDGVAGHLAITRGVAERLGLAAEIKPVAPRFPWRHLAPNGPADPHSLKPLLAEALPDIVLGAGRQTVPFIRALKQAGAFTVIFQSPRTSRTSANIIWVPEHDRLRGSNVITTLTPPHRFTASKLEDLRRNIPAGIARLPKPRITLLLGGPGGGFRYDGGDIETFAKSIEGVVGQAGSVLITPSRRTPSELLLAADQATRTRPRIFWDGEGDNPYPYFLATADWLVVTADSVNMTGEACATGRPVYVFTPSGGRAKFLRFHQRLQNYGATRPLPERLQRLEDWDYAPIHSADWIAEEIQRRWLHFQSTRSGG
jgi:mitochondrial fission protein ELM1